MIVVVCVVVVATLSISLATRAMLSLLTDGIFDLIVTYVFNPDENLTRFRRDNYLKDTF